MRAAFMASDAIALGAIEYLHSRGALACIVSNPDKPKGRGKKLQPNDVSAWALERGVELMRPERAPDAQTVERMRELGADIVIVMAYGCMLKDNILKFSQKYPCLNLHASVLPQLRGASPVESAIALGFEKTGVSLMRIEPRMDAGAVCAVKEVAIEKSDTSASLRKKICAASAQLLEEKFDDIENLNLNFVPQSDADATYVRKLDKEDSFLDFRKSAAQLDCRIRAFGAGIFEYKNELIKIKSARAEDCGKVFKNCGEVLKASVHEGLRIACSSGVLVADILQRPCLNALCAKDFFAGFAIEENIVLKSFDNKNLLR